MTLKEAQMFCCNNPTDFENIFNARAYVTVVPSKQKRNNQIGGDTVTNTWVVDWETKQGPGAFCLEYSDFRTRFWTPLPKKTKQMFVKLNQGKCRVRVLSCCLLGHFSMELDSFSELTVYTVLFSVLPCPMMHLLQQQRTKNIHPQKIRKSDILFGGIH